MFEVQLDNDDQIDLDSSPRKSLNVLNVANGQNDTQNDLYFVKSNEKSIKNSHNSSNQKPISQYSINKPPVYQRLTPQKVSRPEKIKGSRFGGLRDLLRNGGAPITPVVKSTAKKFDLLSSGFKIAKPSVNDNRNNE